MGYRTICLCPTEDTSGCLVAQTNDEWKDIPFEINDSKVANTQDIQRLLAPALCSTTLFPSPEWNTALSLHRLMMVAVVTAMTAV
jgi:hypothetical protein